MAAGAPPSHGLASYPAHAPVPAPAPSHAYAGFWRRFAAALIDTAMLLVGTFILIVLVEFFVVLGLVSSGQQLTDESYVGSLLVVSGILIVLVWLYYAGLESSAWQATIGKRLMHVVVTDLYGRRISFGRATGRFMLTFNAAADLAPGPVVPLCIGATPRHDVFDEAYTVAGHAATRGHPGRLQVRTAFERGDAGLSGAKADTAVSAYLPLGPDIPLGKLLVRIWRWAVHACKGRAYGTLGADSGGSPPRFSGLLCEDRQTLRRQVAGP